MSEALPCRPRNATQTSIFSWCPWEPNSALIRARVNDYYMTKRRVTRPWLVCAVDFIVLSQQRADVARSLGADHIRIRCCFCEWRFWSSLVDTGYNYVYLICPARLGFRVRYTASLTNNWFYGDNIMIRVDRCQRSMTFVSRAIDHQGLIT